MQAWRQRVMTRTTTLLQMLLTVMLTRTQGQLQVGTLIRTWKPRMRRMVRHTFGWQGK